MADRILSRMQAAADEAAGIDKKIDAPPYRDWAAEYLSNLFGKSWSQMHRDFGTDFDFMTRHRGVRMGYVAPRGGGKTKHLCVGYPLYAICHNLEAFILLAGSSASLPEASLDTIKSQLVNNLALRRDYPHATGQGRVWNVGAIVTANGISVRAVGRGKKIRGSSHGRHRPTCILCDDLDDEDSVASDEAKTKAWKWLTSTLIPLGIEAEVNVGVAGTILDDGDIPSRLQKTPGWFCRAYQALMHEPENQALWREWSGIYREETILKNEGKLDRNAQPARDYFEARRGEMERGAIVLWPEQESLYDLQVYRERNGEASFQTEKQGNAAGSAMTEWSPELFDENRILFDRWPYCQHRAMVCDPSKGANEKSDFSPWMYGGIGPDGLLYVDCDMRRRDAGQICVDGCNIAKVFLPHGIGMEADAYGAISILWANTVADQGILCPPMFEIRHGGVHKNLRIRRLTPYLRGYKFRFRSGSPGVELLLQQLRKWPHTKHDDGPDALEMLLRLLIELATLAATTGTNTPASQMGTAWGDTFDVETVGV